MRYNTKNKSKEFLTGFTLAEILVVTAIAAILMVVGVAIYLSNNRFYQNQSAEIRVVSNTRQAADRISEFGRNAVGIESSYVYDSVTYATGATAAVLKVPSINSSGGVISETYDYIIVAQDPDDSSRLILIADPAPGSNRAERVLELTDRLDLINFIYDNVTPSLAKNVNFQIRVRDNGPFPASEEVYGGVTLRNK